jgi:hypothetical protein
MYIQMYRTDRRLGAKDDQLLIWHVREQIVLFGLSRAANSAPVNTGTSLTGTFGGCSPAIGSGISSWAASHVKKLLQAPRLDFGLSEPVNLIPILTPCH